jgi:Ca2+-binding RTX toxin-like protein
MGPAATAVDFRSLRWGVGALLAFAGALLATGLNGETIAPAGETTGTGPLEAEMASLPLSFEPNRGRMDPRVDFLAHSVAGGTLYLSSRQAVLELPQGGERTRVLGLDLLGSAPGSEASGVGALPGKVNSFIGDDPSRWRSGIPTYSRVRYDGVYPGIDLDYYGNQRRLEYDFRLAPGADPERIALHLRGADSLRLAPNGDLVIDAGKATIRQRAPVAFQTIAGERSAVDSAYELHGSTVGFSLGRYDHARPLTIDPLVLAYSTLVGGGASDEARAIAVDSAGAAYLTGSTGSTGATGYPTQDPFQGSLAGGSTDAFVTKLNPDSGGAVTLAYSTYLGGTGNDYGFQIAVDSAGAAYVTGRTGSSGVGTGFPTQDPFQPDNGGGDDAFVTKLNPDSGGAVTLAYSTYLGGGGGETPLGIAVDSAKAAYVTGQTDSSGGTPFPTEDPLSVGATNQGGIDAFVTKLNPDSGGPATLAYSTYLGGDDNDVGNSVAVDSAGAAYLTGYTGGGVVTPFPTEDPFQAMPQGSGDAYVTKLNSDPGGTNDVTLAYSTFLGGGGQDRGQGIAVDSAGAAYLTGYTLSGGGTPFPTQDALDTTLDGNEDGFVTKLNPHSGGALTLAYSTYLGGGSDNDEGKDIAVDSAGAAYISGATSSSGTTPFPTKDAIQGGNGGGVDAFVTTLNPDTGGAVGLGFSTYLGGGGGDTGYGIARDSAGAIYVGGQTNGSGFPTQDPFQATNQGVNDVFAARLAEEVKCNGKVATLFGGSGKDTLTGTSGKDVIDGLGGNDTIKGKGKKDVVCGGDGKDKLVGGKGDDTLLGEAGNDTLKGEAGKDTLKGAGGKDTLRGGAGRDKLKGGAGRDTCIGGGGRDRASSCAKRRSI